MANNDFVQIAHGGAAIVESQAEWAGEAGILNNGFPTGIVLQEQYNKAWRQATAFLAAWGWHSFKKGSGFNTVDDGIWQNLWLRILQAGLSEQTFYEGVTSAANNYVIDNPDPSNLPWTAAFPSNAATAGSKITFVINSARANTNATPPALNFFGTGFRNIYNLDGSTPAPGTLKGMIDLVWGGSGDYWYVTSSSPAIVKSETFGTVFDILPPPYGCRGVAGDPVTGAYNYTVPSGCYLLQAILVGAGGATAPSLNATNGACAGGGGGGCCITPVMQVTPGQVIGYVIGAGGLPPATHTDIGGNGTTTSFGGSYSATGGLGGSFAQIGEAGVGIGPTNSFNIYGSPGAPYASGQIGSAGGIGGRAGGPYGAGGGSSSTGVSTGGYFPGGGAGGPGSGGVQPGHGGGHGCIYILR